MHSWPTVTLPALPASIGDVPQRVCVFDTASRSVRPVGSASGTAGLYVCGITPYDATHLGHAFTYLTFDLLNRAWRDLGLEVNYIQNVTDVDDPLLERANATGVDWRELASSQIELFRSDMTALRVLPPAEWVGATEAIDEVVDLVKVLNGGELIYQIDDAHPDWYFRCGRVPGFGEVSGLNREQMIAQYAERGGDPNRAAKRDPLDALVWRLARDGEPSWPSGLLGQGRPGWHIECTAIALNRLGANFDVQGGGRDLGFPHHEMCHVEGLAASGQGFAQAYVHTGMVGLDGEKMSKSKGNLELVSRLLASGYGAMEVRLALLTHHFHDDWEWFASDIDAGRRRADAWRAAFTSPAGPAAGPVLDAVRRAMRTNLDAPGALAAIDEWSAAVLAGQGDDAAAPALVADVADALLGVRL